MATLTIGGKKVKVDDRFLSLTPEQQQATVDEIASSLGISAVSPAPPEPVIEHHPQEPVQPRSYGEYGMDALRGLGSGIMSGVESIAGGLGDVQQMAGDAATWASKGLGASPEMQQWFRRGAGAMAVPGLPLPLPRTQDVKELREDAFGSIPQSETWVGDAAHTVGAFAPGALLDRKSVV